MLAMVPLDDMEIALVSFMVWPRALISIYQHIKSFIAILSVWEHFSHLSSSRERDLRYLDESPCRRNERTNLTSE